MFPKDSFTRAEGHAIPAMGWLNVLPNDSCCRETSNTIPAMGWLKPPSNDKRLSL